ncbi:MAG: DNRLRE domain-containing protein, partial [Gammaproteobacteria bacterium]|nr:DNRLRE domain-containing protein [Gammaproteobacteria bacterium]
MTRTAQRATFNGRSKHGRRARGSALISVAFLLGIVAVMAALLSFDGVESRALLEREAERETLERTAQAARAHGVWQAKRNACSGSFTVGSTLGANSYSASMTTVATQTLTVFPDKDTYLNEAAPNTGYAASADLNVQESTNSSQRPLFHFDLSSVSPTSYVLSAVAHFYLTANDTQGAINVYELTRFWAEGTTWNAMADAFDAQAVAAVAPQPAAGAWVQINLTGLAQAWVTNSSTNFGIGLKATATDLLSQFASGESSAAFRPYLTLTIASEPISPASIQSTATLASGGTMTNTALDVSVHQPPSIIFVQSSGATADTYTDEGKDKDKNYGASDRLRSQADKRWSLLRFDLTTLNFASEIESAQLGLYAEDVKAGGTGTLDVHRATRAWVEGDEDGKEPDTGAGERGATHENYDGVNAWTTVGADYDPIALASKTITSEGWVEWDVTGQLQRWLAGDDPNDGFVIVAAPGDVDFSSAQSPDTHLRPRLTVTVRCECGVICRVPRSTGTVAVVVGNDNALTSADNAVIQRLGSWGYVVTLVDDGDNLATAVNGQDAVYVAGSANANTIGSGLNNVAMGVVTEQPGLATALGFASATSVPVGKGLILSNPHPISRGLPASYIDLYTASMRGAALTGTLAPGLESLGTWGGEPALAVLETGAALHGGGIAAGRRVWLPHPGGAIDWSFAHEHIDVLLHQSVAWARTTGTTATLPVAYWALDETSGTTAKDSIGGHDGKLVGSVDWTTEGFTSGALEFKGDSSAAIIVPHESTLSFKSALTISAWFNHPNPLAVSRILSKESPGANDNYWLSIFGGEFAFGIGGQFFVTTGLRLLPDR